MDNLPFVLLSAPGLGGVPEGAVVMAVFLPLFVVALIVVFGAMIYLGARRHT